MGRAVEVGVLLAVCLTFVLVLPAPPLAAGTAAAQVPVDHISVGDDCLLVEVARTREHQAVGLRGRPTVKPFDGMLFEFPADTEAPFTMAGTLIPLTIGFYDRTGHPVGRLDMEPCSGTEAACPLYHAPGPYRFALEVEQGRLPEGSLGDCQFTPAGPSRPGERRGCALAL